VTAAKKIDARGIPKSWACIDCGVNTAPGLSNRVELERGFAANVLTGQDGVEQTIDEWSEVYYVKPAVWQAAGMDDFGGCLCIGCLEQRIGRTLVPKDFPRHHAFNSMPGTKRLLARRDRAWEPAS
jgi:hypothetical protein